jgi:hypothetical protein
MLTTMVSSMAATTAKAVHSQRVQRLAGTPMLTKWILPAQANANATRTNPISMAIRSGRLNHGFPGTIYGMSGRTTHRTGNSRSTPPMINIHACDVLNDRQCALIGGFDSRCIFDFLGREIPAWIRNVQRAAMNSKLLLCPDGRAGRFAPGGRRGDRLSHLTM